jgi:endo-1,4-beta-xylanase
LVASLCACGGGDGASSATQSPFGAGDSSRTGEPGAAGSTGAAPDPGNGTAPGGPGEGQSSSLPLAGAGGPSANPGAGPDPDIAVGPPQTLRQAATSSGRLIGTSIKANRLNTATYTATAGAQFNFVTPENEMKWDALERQPGQFSFQNADRIVQFAQANRMKIKGHTLVWHSQLPAWVKQLATRDDVLNAMTQHITQVVTHFKGQIHAWDVVNEAFLDGNSPRLRGSDPNDVNDPNNANGNNGPDSIFRRLIGDDYIDRAFTIAHAADPDALLFYNDFNTEGTSAKANAVYTMVQGMLQRGIPINGVGLQMHITSNVDGQRSAQQISQNIERLTALGLQVIYSELDVSLCGTAAIDQRRQQQTQRLADVTKACTDHPLCTAVTFWGVDDADSWRDSACNGGRSEPLLFDASFQPKADYEGVFDALVAAGTKTASAAP